jgi:hypothetical protein
MGREGEHGIFGVLSLGGLTQQEERVRYDDLFSGLVTGHAENSAGRMVVNGCDLG